MPRKSDWRPGRRYICSRCKESPRPQPRPAYSASWQRCCMAIRAPTFSTTAEARLAGRKSGLKTVPVMRQDAGHKGYPFYRKESQPVSKTESKWLGGAQTADYLGVTP